MRRKFRPVSPSRSQATSCWVLFGWQQMLNPKLYNLTLLRNGALAIGDVLWSWWPPYNPPALLTLDATATASTATEDHRISMRSWSTFPKALPPNSPEKSINSITTAPNEAQKSDMQITSNDLSVLRSGRDGFTTLWSGLSFTGENDSRNEGKYIPFWNRYPYHSWIKRTIINLQKCLIFVPERRGRW